MFELVRAGDQSVGSQLQCTWGSGVRKCVIDYMMFGKAIEIVEMVVEDSGKVRCGIGP